MRTGDYVNAEYDRKLAEFKALKAQLKQEGGANSSPNNSSNSNKPSSTSTGTNARPSFRQESRFR